MGNRAMRSSSTERKVLDDGPLTLEEQSDIETVSKKLKNHPDFKDLKIDDKEIKESSRILSNPRLLKEVYFDQFPSSPTKWRVKLILSSIEIPSVLRLGYRVLPKSLKKFHYGLLHTALQIGFMVISWGKESVVIPSDLQEYLSFKAVVALDADILSKDIQDKVVSRVCEEICRWNTKKKWEANGANCQKFVDSILETIDVKTDLSGAIGEFLQKLMSCSEPEKVLFTNPEDKNQQFKTHADLDMYCWEKKFDERSSEFRLLKAYDRIMWARYYSAQQGLKKGENNNELTASLETYRPYEESCPFGDPTHSGSLLYEF
jgi:hypothetical protein